MRNRARKAMPQPAWMRTLQPGDVLIEKTSGSARVVRTVTLFSDGDLRCITLAIKRCSWTKRAYTHSNFTDVRLRFAPTGVRVALNKRVDRQLEACIRNFMPEGQTLTCCDGKDMP